MFRPFSSLVLTCLILAFPSLGISESDFDTTIQPFLQEYCIECHGGEKVKGEGQPSRTEFVNPVNPRRLYESVHALGGVWLALRPNLRMQRHCTYSFMPRTGPVQGPSAAEASTKNDIPVRRRRGRTAASSSASSAGLQTATVQPVGEVVQKSAGSQWLGCLTEVDQW